MLDQPENLVDRLDPWTEIIGTLLDVGLNSVTISARKEYKLPVKPEEIERCSSELKKGSHIGIIITRDGSMRVRMIEPEE